MIRATITFFILSLIAVLFGAYGVLGLSRESGQFLLMLFLSLSLLSFIGSLFERRKHHKQW